MRSLYVFFISLSLFFSSMAMGYALPEIDNLEEIVWAVNQYEHDWNAGCVRDRIYVKPEALFFTNDKEFLVVGPFLVPIGIIQIDADGLHFCSEGWLFWECCKCHFWNSYDWNTCQNCWKKRC